MYIHPKVAELKVGDDFYSQSYSTYHHMIVEKIGKSGVITAHYFANPEGKVLFNPDGRERGRGYYGSDVDTSMPYADRTIWLANQEKIKDAALKFSQLSDVLKSRNFRNAEKEDFIKVLDELKKQIGILEIVVDNLV